MGVFLATILHPLTVFVFYLAVDWRAHQHVPRNGRHFRGLLECARRQSGRQRIWWLCKSYWKCDLGALMRRDFKPCLHFLGGGAWSSTIEPTAGSRRQTLDKRAHTERSSIPPPNSAPFVVFPTADLLHHHSGTRANAAVPPNTHLMFHSYYLLPPFPLCICPLLPHPLVDHPCSSSLCELECA